jgi:hypothetical protein
MAPLRKDLKRDATLEKLDIAIGLKPYTVTSVVLLAHIVGITAL